MNQPEVKKYEGIYDEEDSRFIKSFTVNEEEKIVQFFEEYGFVVVRDIISNDVCLDTIKDIWSIVQKHSPNVNPEDPRTYTSWLGIKEEGILPYEPVFSQAAVKNRINEDLYKVFTYILEEKELIVNHDRYGLFRPTNQVKCGEEIKDFPFYKTQRNLHLDMNPWKYLTIENQKYCDDLLNKIRYDTKNDFIMENNYIGSIFSQQPDAKDLKEINLPKVARKNLQALINLKDNLEEDGGFQCVPGFHKKFIDWTIENSKFGNRYSSYETFIWLPSEMPIYQDAVRITARAGSLVIWSQMVAHGSCPNNSPNMRFAQFLKVFPKKYMSEERAERRRKKVGNQIRKLENLEVNELAQKFLGLTPY